jgi:C4-type Zn-finger protein
MEINIEEYLEYMQDKADNTDSWWLSDWIENRTNEYLEESLCPNCGSKIKQTNLVWSTTRNYVFEENLVCAKCGYLINHKDLRKNVKAELKLGNVKTKDVKTLKKELDIL